MLKQEDIHHHDQDYEPQQQEEEVSSSTNNNNSNTICATTTVWFSGSKIKRPTIYLPKFLAKKYKMDRPCRIIFVDVNDGILMKFLHKV